MFGAPHKKLRRLIRHTRARARAVNFRDPKSALTFCKVDLDSFLSALYAHSQIEDRFIVDEMLRRAGPISLERVREFERSHFYQAKNMEKIIFYMKQILACCGNNGAMEAKKAYEAEGGVSVDGAEDEAVGVEEEDGESADLREMYGQYVVGELNNFINDYLPHMQEEESFYQPLIMEHFTFGELQMLRGRIIKQHQDEWDGNDSGLPIKEGGALGPKIPKQGIMRREGETESDNEKEENGIEEGKVLSPPSRLVGVSTNGSGEVGLDDLPIEIVSEILLWLVEGCRVGDGGGIPAIHRCAEAGGVFVDAVMHPMLWKRVDLALFLYKDTRGSDVRDCVDGGDEDVYDEEGALVRRAGDEELDEEMAGLYEYGHVDEDESDVKDARTSDDDNNDDGGVDGLTYFRMVLHRYGHLIRHVDLSVDEEAIADAENAWTPSYMCDYNGGYGGDKDEEEASSPLPLILTANSLRGFHQREPSAAMGLSSGYGGMGQHFPGEISPPFSHATSWSTSSSFINSPREPSLLSAPPATVIAERLVEEVEDDEDDDEDEYEGEDGSIGPVRGGTASVVDDQLVREVLDQCPNLEMLDLRGCGESVTDVCFKNAGERAPRVRHIDFSGCRQISDRAVKYLTGFRGYSPALPLVHIDLSGCSLITDMSLIRLSASAGNTLVYASFSGCPRVTGKGLQTLIESCSRLDVSSLSFCDHIILDRTMPEVLRTEASGCQHACESENGGGGCDSCAVESGMRANVATLASW